MNSRLTVLWRIVLLTLLTGYSTRLLAHHEQNFKLYKAEDGLSNSSITGIVQDSTGYMWIGTMRGLNRFDGKKITQFHTGTDNTSLPDETVTRLTWLDAHRLAVSTSMGVQVINTANG